MIDYVGQTINGWIIVKRIPHATKNGTSKYVAKCEVCGNVVRTSMHTIRHGAGCPCKIPKAYDTHIGEIYGCMKIIKALPIEKIKRERKFLCKCVGCGKEAEYPLSRLRRLKSESCFHVNQYRIPRQSMYMWKSRRLGCIYRCMFSRCYNEKTAGVNWKYYGEKGIGVCKEWTENPASFQDWALSHGYSENLTIDRIDSDKDYTPENCRWISLEENVKRASEKLLTVDGLTMNIKEWENYLHVKSDSIGYRHRRYGEDYAMHYIQDMLHLGYDSQNSNSCLLTINGNTMTLSDWARKIDVKPDTLSAYHVAKGKEETIRHIQAIMEFGYDRQSGRCPYVVDGIAHSDKEWTELLNLPKRRLSKMKSKQGYDAVIDYIRGKIDGSPMI